MECLEGDCILSAHLFRSRDEVNAACCQNLSPPSPNSGHTLLGITHPKLPSADMCPSTSSGVIALGGPSPGMCVQMQNCMQLLQLCGMAVSACPGPEEMTVTVQCYQEVLSRH